METLLWLVPLPLAVLYAVVRNAAVRRQPRRRRRGSDGIAEHARFRQTLSGGS